MRNSVDWLNKENRGARDESPRRVGHIVVCALAGLLVSWCASCQVAGPGHAGAPSASPQQVYQVTGVIKELKPDGKTAVIAHEAIPGYMEAMTMPLPVKDPRELANLKPGDRVTFRMIVAATEGWIDRVAKVDAAPEPKATVEPTFHIARNVEPLDVGDVVPEYHFTNELGKAVSLSQFRGRALALTFFFHPLPIPEFLSAPIEQLRGGAKEAVDDAERAQTMAPAFHLV